MAGMFTWFDLAAKDPGAAQAFYAELFGWPMAPAGDAPPYRAWAMDGERPWAGVTDDDELTGGRWVPYVQVDDLEAARARAISLGATLVRDSTVGPAGTAVTIADPAGALLALFVPHPS